MLRYKKYQLMGTKDWEWSVGATYAKNWSKVKELWDGLDEYTIPVG